MHFEPAQQQAGAPLDRTNAVGIHRHGADLTGTGGDGDWLNGANWSSGAIPTGNVTNAAGEISLTGSSAVQSLTLGALNTTPSFTVSGGASLSMCGALVVASQSGHQGKLTVTGAGSSVKTSNYFRLRGGGEVIVEQGGYAYGNIAYIGENFGTASLTVPDPSSRPSCCPWEPSVAPP